jgi:hypothetical protein
VIEITHGKDGGPPHTVTIYDEDGSKTRLIFGDEDQFADWVEAHMHPTSLVEDGLALKDMLAQIDVLWAQRTLLQTEDWTSSTAEQLAEIDEEIQELRTQSTLLSECISIARTPTKES